MKISDLSKQLISIFPQGPLERQLLFNLVYWLADGKGLPQEQVARRLGYPASKLADLSKSLPGLEVDGSGNIISVAGLSVRETAYPMDGEVYRVYALSALDAVIIPIILLKRMTVEYRPPDTSSLIHLRFGFEQAFAVQPEEAVISFESREVFLKPFREGRSEFLFFPTPDAANRWLWQHPNGFTISVKKVFIAAVELRRTLMDSNTQSLSQSGSGNGF